MITKERINELIDNQKTIYFVNWTYKKVESVELIFADIYDHDTKLIVSDNNKSVIWRLELSKLFEIFLSKVLLQEESKLYLIGSKVCLPII